VDWRLKVHLLTFSGLAGQVSKELKGIIRDSIIAAGYKNKYEIGNIPGFSAKPELSQYAGFAVIFHENPLSRCFFDHSMETDIL
jgi:hypothetical protein